MNPRVALESLAWSLKKARRTRKFSVICMGFIVLLANKAVSMWSISQPIASNHETCHSFTTCYFDVTFTLTLSGTTVIHSCATNAQDTRLCVCEMTLSMRGFWDSLSSPIHIHTTYNIYFVCGRSKTSQLPPGVPWVYRRMGIVDFPKQNDNSQSTSSS